MNSRHMVAPMMTMTILAPRREAMTHEEFRTYLLDVHGPLVRSITEVAAEIRRYTYNFPRLGETDLAFGHPLADLDVITQGIFDSREAQLDNMKHERFKEFLRPDEANFADTKRAVMHYTDQHVVIDGPTTDTKVFYLRRRRPGLDRVAFQADWLARFPRSIAAFANLGDVVSRYVQNHVQAEEHHPDGSSAKFYDVIDELWIRDSSALALLADADALTGVRTLEAELLATARTRSFVAESVVNIG